MRPLIFISHSAKDSEVATPDPDNQAAVERQRRLEYARLVRSEIVAALNAITDADGQPRFDVWLDQNALAGGDNWTAKLHEVLGTCHGAVLLLDEISAQSPWVRKEATILTWRLSMASAVRVVPVSLGRAAPELFTQGDWAPTALGQLQHVRLARDPMTTDSAAELAALVAKRFENLTVEDVDTPMGQWIASVGALIEGVHPFHKRRAGLGLGISDADWAALPRPHITMAHHLLHLTLDEKVVEAVSELLRGLDARRRLHLVNRVVPIWVCAEAANHLLCSDVDKAERLFLVNVCDQRSAREYLERAWCGTIYESQVASIPGATGEDPGEVLTDVDEALRHEFGYSSDEQSVLDLHLQSAEKMFVIMGRNAVRKDVIGALRAKYPNVRVMIASGHDIGEACAALPEAVLIKPRVAPGEEEKARMYCRCLEINVGGRY